MREVKHICDKCRGCIVEDRTELRVESGPLRRSGVESLDLCPDCAAAVADLIRAGRAELPAFALSTR
jgi:hypothetical protein